MNAALPLLWLVAFGLASGYDARFIGTRSDEFRTILNAVVNSLRRLRLRSLHARSTFSCLGLPPRRLAEHNVVRSTATSECPTGRCHLWVPCPALPGAMTKSSFMSDVY